MGRPLLYSMTNRVSSYRRTLEPRMNAGPGAAVQQPFRISPRRSVRPYLRYILFLALAIAAPASAGAQTASWWYPLGPPGATRFQDAPTNDTARPVIRWRTSALRGSPVVLVGALRPDSDGGQQIVGQIGNEVRIIESEGVLERAVANFNLPPGSSVRLTGLFDVTAPSVDPTDRPNAVGLGITREQPADPALRLYGLLLDPLLAPFQQLKIERLLNSDAANNTASIYPVAAYTPPDQSAPIAIALVSQDAYTPGPGVDTMINGIRRYRINSARVEADSIWAFKLAPRTYPQAPALARDTIDGGLLLAPALSSYFFGTQVTVAQPIPGRGTIPTQSNETYGLLTKADQPNLIDPVELRVVPATAVVPGEAHSYVARLARGASEPERRYRIVTENHDALRPGLSRVYLRYYDQSLDGQLGLIEDQRMRNVGWSIVQADLDGTDPSTRFPTGLALNKGLEIVGAMRNLDGSRRADNRLFLIRYNREHLIGGAEFGVFATQAFNGDLLAGGDLVRDVDNKDEIVVANGAVVSILRLRRYEDPLLISDVPEYFETVASYTLDAPVTSAAIADVDRDGNNDLIVVTENGTYVIGRPHPAPLGTVLPSRTELCSGDTLSFSWKRAVGGGESGLRMEIIRVDSGSVVVDSQQIASTPERFTATLGALPTGRYRLQLTDPDVPSVTARSAEFTIQPVSIEAFEVASADAGERVTIATRARCADTLVLEYSRLGSSTWQRVGSPKAAEDGIVSFENIPMPCPLESNCDETTAETRIRFRFSTPDGRVVSPISQPLVRVRERTVHAPEPPQGNPRARTIVWSPDEFECDSIAVRLSTDGGTTWLDVGSFGRLDGQGAFDVPGEIEQEVQARLCCEVGCGSGSVRFLVSEIREANFIAPNPYDPTDADGATAAIIYRLASEGTVTITIFDASRAVVRAINTGEPLRAGLHTALWDGRNGEGEIVADGTYICIIASSSGERLLLPLSIAKR
jgi:hypothetical protein